LSKFIDFYQNSWYNLKRRRLSLGQSSQQRSKFLMSTTMADTSSPKKKGGLEGIVAATTALSKVEGTAGRLVYRGYNIHDLARTTSFEEVAHLLWFGHLPNEQELATLKKKLAAQRTLPVPVVQTLSNLPKTVEPMDALRTATSLWGAMAITGKPTIE